MFLESEHSVIMGFESSTFRARLNELRVANGLSQEDLARFIGISTRSINNYEKRTTDLTVDTLCRLASVLDTTPNYLCGWEDSHE